MQRRATKQSRGANAREREFIATVKQLPCICCDTPGPSIYDHIYGSAKKLYNGLERVHVGHYAGIPLCLHCDSIKTRGSRRAFEDQFGQQVALWLRLIEIHNLEVPENVIAAIQGELSESTPTQSDMALQYMTTVGCKNF
jgi:hypothetical protein